MFIHSISMLHTKPYTTRCKYGLVCFARNIFHASLCIMDITEVMDSQPLDAWGRHQLGHKTGQVVCLLMLNQTWFIRVHVSTDSGENIICYLYFLIPVVCHFNSSDALRSSYKSDKRNAHHSRNLSHSARALHFVRCSTLDTNMIFNMMLFNRVVLQPPTRKFARTGKRMCMKVATDASKIGAVQRRCWKGAYVRTQAASAASPTAHNQQHRVGVSGKWIDGAGEWM